MKNRSEANKNDIKKIAIRKSRLLYLKGALRIIELIIIFNFLLLLLGYSIFNVATVIGLLLLGFYFVLCPIIRTKIEKYYLAELIDE